MRVHKPAPLPRPFFFARPTCARPLLARLRAALAIAPTMAPAPADASARLALPKMPSARGCACASYSRVCFVRVRRVFGLRR